MKNLSPAVLLALKKALAAIYWTKKELRFFIQHSIDHGDLVSRIDWDN